MIQWPLPVPGSEVRSCFKYAWKNVLFDCFSAQISINVIKKRNLQVSVNVSLEVRLILFRLKQASLAFLGHDIRFNVPEVVVEK